MERIFRDRQILRKQKHEPAEGHGDHPCEGMFTLQTRYRRSAQTATRRNQPRLRVLAMSRQHFCSLLALSSRKGIDIRFGEYDMVSRRSVWSAFAASSHVSICFLPHHICLSSEGINFQGHHRSDFVYIDTMLTRHSVPSKEDIHIYKVTDAVL